MSDGAGVQAPLGTPPPVQILSPDPRVTRLVSGLSNVGSASSPVDLPPAVLVLNKCEMVPRDKRPELLSLATAMRELHPFQDTFWISALKGAGVGVAAPDSRRKRDAGHVAGPARPPGRGAVSPPQATHRAAQKAAPYPAIPQARG